MSKVGRVRNIQRSVRVVHIAFMLQTETRMIDRRYDRN